MPWIVATTHRHHYGHNTVQDGVNLLWVAVFEAHVTDPDDFVQVILDSLGRLLLGDLGAQGLEVFPQLLCLWVEQQNKMKMCLRRI